MKKTEWKTYQELELISESLLPSPMDRVAARLHLVWRSLTRTQPAQLAAGKQMAHLEQCWQQGRMKSASPPQFWQAVQEWFHRSFLQSTSEPLIQRIADRSGQVWWCATDPATGAMSYLESEAEVDGWLEEYFYAASSSHRALRYRW